MMETDLWRQWRAAARNGAVDAALRRLYDEVAAAVQERGPQCWTSGRCCNFERFGHRLYVTGLEVAWVLVWLDQLPTTTASPTQAGPKPPGAKVRVKQTTSPGQGPFNLRAIDPAGPCPFQQGHLCGVHTIRPLGCRIFFCQRGTDDWQHELYERFLGQLRALHERENLPYRYLEWRAGLAEAASMMASTSNG